MLVPICVRLYRKYSREELSKGEHERAPIRAPRPLNAFEQLCTATLTIAWVLQVVHKCLYGPRRLISFLYPCHPISALVLYCLFKRKSNYRVASYVWCFTLQCCILSGIAMALPDTSDIAEQYRCVHSLCALRC